MKKISLLTDNDKKLICKFIEMKYPSLYKTDNTDRILFVELVDFDVCPYLLGKKSINTEQYNYIMNEYERYLTQTNPLLFDEYAKNHYDILEEIMKLFVTTYKIN